MTVRDLFVAIVGLANNHEQDFEVIVETLDGREYLVDCVGVNFVRDTFYITIDAN